MLRCFLLGIVPALLPARAAEVKESSPPRVFGSKDRLWRIDARLP
jgi:hypothetical protein